MTKRRRIIVACPPNVPSFASLDARLLSAEFDTEIIPVSGVTSVARLRRRISTADALLVWFLGRHAMPVVALARLYGVPVVSVIGGFEVAWIEDLRYGVRPGSVKERFLRWMITSSKCVLSVSSFSLLEAQSRFPDLRHKFRLVYNAVDTSIFDMPSDSVRSGVISVGVINRVTISRKAWNCFLDVARQMPDIQFSIVGATSDSAGREFVRQLPENVSWFGLLDLAELVRMLQVSSVYFQPSRHEAFCVALAEAMSCGCFPVVSSRGALPEVVGNSGTVVADLTPGAAESAIRAALARLEEERDDVRRRIVENFDLERRRQHLCALFHDVLSKRPKKS